MENFSVSINNAFFFVAEKIINIQGFFWNQAWSIGKIVLLIAILSAGLNYALTGTGLKENAVKILKATLFFLIVILAYPKIIGFITWWTFDMAKQSVYPSVHSYFNEVADEYTTYSVGYTPGGAPGGLTFTQLAGKTIIRRDNGKLFDDLTVSRSVSLKNGNINYTSVSPAAVFKVIFFITGECFSFADNSNDKPGLLGIAIPEFSRVLKGLLCGFAIILTGIFALLEYLVCFLEFMLVASVGVILFPLSIWEGSKFMAEKFIGAIVGFFIKLLLCNIAVFLLLYGFISLFYIISEQKGFNGEVDQIIFIMFTCLLFLYICKSAPGIAQSLLTGSPSLSAAGAISAATGAVAAAGTVMKLAKKADNKMGMLVGGGANAVKGGIGDIIKANAARNAVKAAGGGGGHQAAAFLQSMGKSAAGHLGAGALGLTRNLLGIKGGGSSPGQIMSDKKAQGNIQGLAYAAKHGIGGPTNTPTPPPPPPPPPPPLPPPPP